MTPPNERLHYLDSLRGLAAVYVVLFHMLLVPRAPLNVGSAALNQFIHFGGTGVFLFFVISGFSLELTWIRHNNTASPIGSYAASRFFRIVPLFFIILAIHVIGQRLMWGRVFSVKLIALNMSMLYNLFPGKQEGIVWASWTIGVEMLFYLVFPLLHRLRTAYLVLATTLLMAGLALEMQITPRAYYQWSFLGYFPMFLIGICALRSVRWLGSGPSPLRSGHVMIGTGMVCLAFCMIPVLAEKLMVLRVPIALSYALVLVGCALAKPRILELRMFRFFGAISYSLYLVHAPVVFFVAEKSGIRQRLPDPVAYWVELFVALALASAIAFVLYRTVEHYGDKMGKAVRNRWTPRLSDAARTPNLYTAPLITRPNTP